MTTLYRFFSDTGRLLYVGISGNIPRRLGEHSKQKDWWTEVHSVTLEHFHSRGLARTAEVIAIRTEHPVYNIADTALSGDILWEDRVNAGWDRLSVSEPAMPQLLEFSRSIRECFSGGSTWCANAWWLGGLKRLTTACVGWHRVSEDGDPWLRTRDAYEIATSVVYWRTLPGCRHPELLAGCVPVARESFDHALTHLGAPRLREWYGLPSSSGESVS